MTREGIVLGKLGMKLIAPVEGTGKLTVLVPADSLGPIDDW